jgi:hypothetical protein
MHGHGKFDWPKELGCTFIGVFENDKRVSGKIYDSNFNIIKVI